MLVIFAPFPTKLEAVTIPEKVGIAILLGASLMIGICPWILTDKIKLSLNLLEATN